MERSHPFWSAPSFSVAPSGSGRGYTAEVKDQGGAPLATCDAEGTIRDASGDVLLSAPVRWQNRGDRPTDAGIEIADAGASSSRWQRTARTWPRSRWRR
jgi:hypothetical protein